MERRKLGLSTTDAGIGSCSRQLWIKQGTIVRKRKLATVTAATQTTADGSYVAINCNPNFGSSFQAPRQVIVSPGAAECVVAMTVKGGSEVSIGSTKRDAKPEARRNATFFTTPLTAVDRTATTASTAIVTEGEGLGTVVGDASKEREDALVGTGNLLMVLVTAFVRPEGIVVPGDMFTVVGYALMASGHMLGARFALVGLEDGLVAAGDIRVGSEEDLTIARDVLVRLKKDSRGLEEDSETGGDDLEPVDVAFIARGDSLQVGDGLLARGALVAGKGLAGPGDILAAGDCLAGPGNILAAGDCLVGPGNTLFVAQGSARSDHALLVGHGSAGPGDVLGAGNCLVGTEDVLVAGDSLVGTEDVLGAGNCLVGTEDVLVAGDCLVGTEDVLVAGDCLVGMEDVLGGNGWPGPGDILVERDSLEGSGDVLEAGNCGPGDVFMAGRTLVAKGALESGAGLTIPEDVLLVEDSLATAGHPLVVARPDKKDFAKRLPGANEG